MDVTVIIQAAVVVISLGDEETRGPLVKTNFFSVVDIILGPEKSSKN